jgi:hypothetical protein
MEWIDMKVKKRDVLLLLLRLAWLHYSFCAYFGVCRRRRVLVHYL